MALDMKSIGLRIRSQREFLGYTREHVAELIEVTPKFCSDIELGVKGMSLNTLDMLSHSLKLSAEYILYGKTAGETLESVDLIYEMLASCPPAKRQHVVEAVKNIILAIE